VLDELVPKQRGLVTVQPKTRNAVFATVMEYKRRADGGFFYLSAMPVVPPLGNVLTDTYNTYLGQDMELIVANFSNENVKTFVTMTRSSGEKIIKGELLELLPNSIKVINLNERERADEYGVIKVEAPLGSSVSAWASRIKHEQYKLTTQAQQ